MSDSFSAPVHDARKAWLKNKAANLASIIEIDLSKSLDSIVIHNLADDLDGLARDFRQVVELSIDEYQRLVLEPPGCPDCGTQSIEEAIGQVCNTCKRGVIR